MPRRMVLGTCEGVTFLRCHRGTLSAEQGFADVVGRNAPSAMIDTEIRERFW